MRASVGPGTTVTLIASLAEHEPLLTATLYELLLFALIVCVVAPVLHK